MQPPWPARGQCASRQPKQMQSNPAAPRGPSNPPPIPLRALLTRNVLRLVRQVLQHRLVAQWRRAAQARLLQRAARCLLHPLILSNSYSAISSLLLLAFTHSFILFIQSFYPCFHNEGQPAQPRKAPAVACCLQRQHPHQTPWFNKPSYQPLDSPGGCGSPPGAPRAPPRSSARPSGQTPAKGGGERVSARLGGVMGGRKRTGGRAGMNSHALPSPAARLGVDTAHKYPTDSTIGPLQVALVIVHAAPPNIGPHRGVQALSTLPIVHHTTPKARLTVGPRRSANSHKNPLIDIKSPLQFALTVGSRRSAKSQSGCATRREMMNPTSSGMATSQPAAHQRRRAF